MASGLNDAEEARAQRRFLVPGLVVTGVMAVLTVVHLGASADSVGWGLAQCLLGGLAIADLETRRIPNVVTGPAAVLAVTLRVAFVHSALIEILVAGAAAAAVFLLFALFARMGVGDVKLAGLLGLLLGRAVVPGLLVGTIAGGVAAIALLASPVAWRGRTLAYGPYLCLGGAVAILAFGPPALV